MGKDEYPPIPKIIVGLSVIKINNDFLIENKIIDIDMKNLNIFFFTRGDEDIFITFKFLQ